MSWTRTESACAGEVATTADAAPHTAATVSAARRAEVLLGKGIPPGNMTERRDGSARQRVGLVALCDTHRAE
ncbi:hypothetical protein HEK131_16410 [Streptomyces seoulensis]|nr:hypothetical protein HEK131_16410 [Streptomyces seoulensis]